MHEIIKSEHIVNILEIHWIIPHKSGVLCEGFSSGNPDT